MKKALLIFLLALTGTCVWAAEADTIHVSNPETWVGSELQRYVGRTVVFDCPIYVCNIPNNTSGGTMTVSTRRIYAPTNQAYPRTPEYNQLTSLNNSGQMRLTGASGYHRMGEKIYNLKVKVNSTSSLDWINGEWSGNTRADMLKMAENRFPELGDYRLLICTANLEYYLTVPNTAPGSTMGPSSHAEHQAQREKVSKGLAAINADIYGFVEIESGDSALAELARDLSKNTGRHYTYIHDGSGINGTYTKAGFVYCTETVETIGTILSNGAVTNNRSQMQCFVEKATGEKFLLSENHFKAKSGTGSGQDADQHDGQGQYNYKRQQEAQSVIEQYNRNRNQLKEHDIIVMGDLNAYAKEDPITKFTKAGFTDLHRYFHADSSYSYTFSGQAGYLDHAICSPTMLKQVTGMVGFHVNSDEADAYTYDKSNDRTMFRYSDHDPVVIGLKLDSMLSFEPAMAINTEELLYNQDADIVISNALQEEQRSFYRLYTINGWLVTEGEIIDQAYEVARPQQSGVYILRIYANGTVHQKKIIIL